MSEDQYATGGFLSKPIHIAHAEEGGVIPLYGKVTTEDIARIICTPVPKEFFVHLPTSYDLSKWSEAAFTERLFGQSGTWKRNP